MDWYHFSLVVVPLLLSSVSHIVHASIAAQGKPDHGVIVDNLSNYAQVIAEIAGAKSPPQTASAPSAASTP